MINRMTMQRLAMLKRAIAAGPDGYYTSQRHMLRRAEKLCAAGLLEVRSGARQTFFVITDEGRKAFMEAQGG